jgi:hypothetical protein
MKPVIWNGTAASMINLLPELTDWGRLSSINGQFQGGQFRGKAAIWQGTPESRMILHPPGTPPTSGSAIAAMAGTQQVGSYGAGGFGQQHAALWYGTPESFVDLHPSGAFLSSAGATDGSLQGGYVSLTGSGYQAALWAGTPESFINLTPGGFGMVHGMVPGQQVGFKQVGPGLLNHAAMWSGTPESFIDLDPGTTGGSKLFATCGTAQVGTANGDRATIWFGTAQSAVSLHDFLPPEYSFSRAFSVYEADGLFYVGSDATHFTGRTEAFLGIGVPAPSTAFPFALGLIFAASRRR